MRSLVRGLIAALRLILFAKCEHTSRVASDELDGPVGRADRIAARLHEAVCPGCRRGRDQLRVIDEAMRRRARAKPPSHGLSPEARERINAALLDAVNDEDGDP